MLIELVKHRISAETTEMQLSGRLLELNNNVPGQPIGLVSSGHHEPSQQAG